MQYAVIDIGSNSVRFMLDMPGKLNPKQLATTRIGQGISQTNTTLSQEAMERTAQAVAKFVNMGREAGATILCFATSAVREAPNRNQFVERVSQLCGITVEVISGEDEAKFAYLGASGGSGAVLDIGGGSTEAIFAGPNGLVANSLRIGSVRLLSVDPCTTPVDGEKLLQCAFRAFEPLSLPSSMSWVGVGGTVTSLSAILLGLVQYSPEKVHGFVIKKEALSALYQTLCSLDYASRAKLPGVSPQRVDTIVTGCAILLAFLNRYHIPSITASEKDGMDGFLMNYKNRVDKSTTL